MLVEECCLLLQQSRIFSWGFALWFVSGVPVTGKFRFSSGRLQLSARSVFVLLS
jgi:hypothetical protein